MSPRWFESSAGLASFALLLLSSAFLQTSCKEPAPASQLDDSAVAAPQPAIPPATKNLPVAKATLDDVRSGIRRAGWTLKADLSTQFDSCKASQFDVSKGENEGRVQLYECTDEYDARRRETSVKNGGDDSVIERESGRMLEVVIRGHKDEAQKLLAGILGR